MKKSKNSLNGLKYILAGLALMVLASALSECVALFKSIAIVYWAELLVKFIGWIMVVLGMYISRPMRVEFKRGFVFAVAGLVMIIGSGALAFKEYRLGLEALAFIDMYVMFADYLANLAMLAVYYLTTKAMSQLAAKNGNIELGLKGIKSVKKGIIVIAVTWLVTPFAYVFPAVVKFILAGASIVCGTFIQLMIIGAVNKRYKEL